MTEIGQEISSSKIFFSNPNIFKIVKLIFSLVLRIQEI